MITQGRRATQHLRTFTEASLAVLPLENLSRNPSDDPYCDGLTADIITNISRFRDVLVIARHSAFLFKKQDLPAAQIGKQLGVRYLLSGGLLRSERQIKLSVKLTEAATSVVIWTDCDGGELGDIFAFQDELTDVIAARLAVQIKGAERQRLAKSPPNNLAYWLNLRGQELGLSYRRDSNWRARRLYEKAIELSPDYGRSYAGLSRTFNLEFFYAWADSPESALDRAVDLAKIAITRDSLDARGYSELGYAYLYSKRHDESLAAYERAIELNPNDADILSEMADALVFSDDAGRAIDLLEHAMRLNPFYPDDYLWHLADAYFVLADYERTISTLQRMQVQSEAHRMLAASHGLLGNLTQARCHASQVRRVNPNFSVAHLSKVAPYREGAPQLKALIEGLRRAGLK